MILHVWFTSAHFESEAPIQIKGRGKDIEAINNFIVEDWNKMKWRELQKGRTGKEKRTTKVQEGKPLLKLKSNFQKNKNSNTLKTNCRNGSGSKNRRRMRAIEKLFYD